jgi:hypothetical protein
MSKYPLNRLREAARDHARERDSRQSECERDQSVSSFCDEVASE